MEIVISKILLPKKNDRVRISPEDRDCVSAESGAVDVRLDVSAARQVEHVDVGQEAVSGGVEGARPASTKLLSIPNSLSTD